MKMMNFHLCSLLLHDKSILWILLWPYLANLSTFDTFLPVLEIFMGNINILSTS